MDKKIELRVVNIANSQSQASAFAMVLQEVSGSRQIPIIIGSAEAQAIVLKMKDIKPPRPLTHDLFTSVLMAYDITLLEILIYKAQDGVFFSYVYFQRGETTLRIDARTSDAIALAVRFYCPIYIYEAILEEEQIIITDEEPISPPEEQEWQESDTPGNLQSKDLKWLKKKLEEAIQDENYELASKIRDEISRRK
ncbi:MAG: bifunctional nuclease family protein [Bacteroides sp.]|nr:bifunctional nuclease family protein [Bacteroides sp.]